MLLGAYTPFIDKFRRKVDYQGYWRELCIGFPAVLSEFRTNPWLQNMISGSSFIPRINQGAPDVLCD